jgi:hypothetical protein
MTETLETTPARSVEARLEQVEAEVAALKQQMASPPHNSWLDQVIGSTSDMPDFHEVVRYGREAREAQPPTDEVPA